MAFPYKPARNSKPKKAQRKIAMQEDKKKKKVGINGGEEKYRRFSFNQKLFK